MDQLSSSYKPTNELKCFVTEMTVITAVLLYCLNSFVNGLIV
jgi:hypothetical protein